MTSIDQQFQAAIDLSRKLASKPDDETLLELYSYYKQATEGDVEGPRPGPFDFAARAKYDAWKGRQGMSKEVAMKGYTKLVRHLNDR